MGIKIVSQPIGSPILAAASTAMAQANQRTAERQSKMWQQQVEHKYKTKELEETRTFEQAENDLAYMRRFGDTKMPDGVKLNPGVASEYGNNQTAIRNILSGLMMDPRTPEAQAELKRLLERQQQIAAENPDPTSADKYERGRLIVGPDGRSKGPDGRPYAEVPPGGKVISVDENGKEIPPARDYAEDADAKRNKEELARAQKAIADANSKTQKAYDVQRNRAQEAYKRKEKALLDNEKTTDADIANLWREFDSSWGLEAPGLIPMPGTGAAPPAGAFEPEPIAPVGGGGYAEPEPLATPGGAGVAVPESGPGQVLPAAPPGSFVPPTQPLNLGQAGTPVLPGGPSQLSPPKKTLDQRWAEGELHRRMDQMAMDGVTDIKHLPVEEQKIIADLYKRFGGA